MFDFGKRDLTQPNHWKDLNFEDFSFRQDGATILCFEGNGAIKTEDDGQSRANAGCRRNETLMGIKIEATNDIYSTYKDVELIGFSYPQIPGKNVGEMTDECYLALDKKFKTLYENDDGSLKEMDQITKNFSKLVFSSHCYGAVVVNTIFKNIYKNMANKGLSKEEILYTFSQTAHVSYAPHTDETLIPTVRVESFTDSVHRDLYYKYKMSYEKPLNGIAIYHNKPERLFNGMDLTSKQETIQVFSSRLINTYENTDLRNLKDEHEAHYLERDVNWNSAPLFRGKPLPEHAVNLDATSQITGYALSLFTANAIANANSEELIPKPSLEEVHGHLQNILESFSENDLKVKTAPKAPLNQTNFSENNDLTQ